MTKTKLAAVALALALALAMSSVAHAQSSGHNHGAMANTMMPSPRDAASTREFKAADMAMTKNMQVPYTGDPDVDFRNHMIPHHLGAINMAKVALKYAKDPQTKEMAQSIIDAQEREIADMQGWLKAHRTK